MGPAGPLMSKTWFRIARNVLGEAGSTQISRTYAIMDYEESRAMRFAGLASLDAHVSEDNGDTVMITVVGDQSSISKFEQAMGFYNAGGV